jgi:hypothetical protein
LAAMTTGSTLTATQATVIPESVANAINQLSPNQTAMMSLMAAMNLNYRVPTQATQQYVPPIRPPIQQTHYSQRTAIPKRSDGTLPSRSIWWRRPRRT